MQYHTYELAHAMLSPLRAQSRLWRGMLQQPLNPMGYTHMGKMVAASCEVFESITKRYDKPEWGIETTPIHGLDVPVSVETVWQTPFCNLVHFNRDETVCGKRFDPKVLIVAPMSGHYATLLRGTVQAMIPEHDVYITDWQDARDIPLGMGEFDLDNFIEHVIRMIRYVGTETHVIAVCQPAVPVLAATALMAYREERFRPASITLIGGPIDTRRNPTAVNELAGSRPLSWFDNHVISRVPFGNAGFMRRVYPGFVQLTGFMTMNLDRHINAHRSLFDHLVEGDCDSVAQHRKFYDEYLAVMDLPAEFFLQTVHEVFQRHSLPDGTMMHRGDPVDLTSIRDVTLMTIEGEKDDICGLGQTEAAHDLCANLPPALHYHYVQPNVGHYGVFNGTRWRTEIQPRIREMIRTTRFRRQAAGVSVH